MLRVQIIFTTLISAILTLKNSPSVSTTTTTTENSHACALWTRNNGDDEPSVNGFALGISHLTNATVYVGMGFTKGLIQPSQIHITSRTELTTEQSEYLVIPDGCKCQWVSPANHSGLVLISDSTRKSAIGRKTFPDGRVDISKVFLANMTQCYNLTTTSPVCNDAVTEMLTCESASSTAEAPTVKFKRESCGMWSSIGMHFSASSAFSAGPSVAVNASVNSTAYVGRGQFRNDYAIGRYQDSGVIGSYIATEMDEVLVPNGSQWLIVPQNCSCHWMHPDQAKTRKSLVTSHNQRYVVGRKVFPNGLASIAKVVIGNGSNVHGMWTNLAKKSKSGLILEILVCETLPLPPNACALWTRYNGDDAPSVNGFSAGISVISNTTAYVGMGIYGRWRQPARIQITLTPDSLVGGYTVWSKEKKVDFPEYLVVPDGCKCSWIEPSNAALNRPIILTGDSEVGFAVGRKTFSDGRVAISKVITFTNNSDYMLQWYNPTSDTEVTNETATELLVCETTADGHRPEVKFNTDSCAMWSSIGMIALASLNGFPAINNTFYVGRGQKDGKIVVGRYRVENPAGTYVNVNGGNEEPVDYGSQWLIIPQQCSCCWKHPESITEHKNLVSIPDEHLSYLIGLERLLNGSILISRVNNETFDWKTNLNATEESKYAVEVLICETLPAVSKACALWTRYNGDDAPSVNGFSAGISFISNTSAYVGMATHNDERNQARIQTKNITKGKDVEMSGAFVMLSTEQRVYAEYLVVPDGCKCSWMIPEIALKRAIIFTGNEKPPCAIGRKIFAYGRVGLTKVILHEMTQWFNTGHATVSSDDLVSELLVCELTAPKSDHEIATSRLNLDLPTESCGMWSSIGMIDSSATNGFSAGTSIVSNTAFIGRGQIGKKFLFGRYQNTGDVGTYVLYKSTEEPVAYASQWLIVPENCSCKWMHPDQAKIRKGLITIPDQKYHYMVGRKALSNGLVSIMSVNNDQGSGKALSLGWYANINKAKGEDYATEVLVCENLPTPSNACALWTRYNGDDAPSVNGFAAGISYLSNTTAYVGMGIFGECVLPARIEISNAVGGYVQFTTEIHVPIAEYLVVPDGCECSWMKPSIASNHPGLIFTGSPSQKWAIGRKNFTNDQVGLTRVSTSAKLPSYMLQCYNPTSDTIDCSEKADELLVCEATESTAGRPIVNFTSTDSCGLWSTIGMTNSNGFSAYNYTFYVGRGQTDGKMVVGRYQVENPAGTYVNVNGGIEELVDYGSQLLVIPQNCSCHWIPLSQVKNQKSFITILDQRYNFMVGRKTFPNGTISIFKFNSTTDNFTEVLTCTTFK